MLTSRFSLQPLSPTVFVRTKHTHTHTHTQMCAYTHTRKCRHTHGQHTHTANMHYMHFFCFLFFCSVLFFLNYYTNAEMSERLQKSQGQHYTDTDLQTLPWQYKSQTGYSYRDDTSPRTKRQQQPNINQMTELLRKSFRKGEQAHSQG